MTANRWAMNKPGCLWYIEDNTTQLFWDYNRPLNKDSYESPRMTHGMSAKDFGSALLMLLTKLQWIYNYTTSSRKMFPSMYDFPFFNWKMFMIFGDCSFNDDLPWKLSKISAVHLFSPSQKRRAQTVPGVESAYTDRFDYICVLVHN